MPKNNLAAAAAFGTDPRRRHLPNTVVHAHELVAGDTLYDPVTGDRWPVVEVVGLEPDGIHTRLTYVSGLTKSTWFDPGAEVIILPRPTVPA